jgi:hypothetical protein
MGGEGVGLFVRPHVHPETFYFWMALSAVREQQAAKPLFCSLLLNADC